MPVVGETGLNVTKRKVRRSVPKAKPAPKVQRPATPDQQDRTRANRSQQLARSVPKAGDAPQTRAADTKKGQAYVKKQYDTKPGSIKRLYVKGTTVPPKIATDVAFNKSVTKGRLAQAQIEAPVLKVLDQTTRPLHAVAASARADIHTIKTKGLKYDLTHIDRANLHAAAQGIRNKDKSTFSDVYTDAGWKPKGTLGKIAKGVAAFATDVTVDPTTYVTGGAGSVAAHAGEKAAVRVSKKALDSGLTKDQAARMAERARNAAEKAAPDRAGATLKVAGHEVPGVRRATAQAARPVRAAGRKATTEGARSRVRSIAADVNPDVAPVGVSKTVSRKAIQATRTARGKTGAGNRAAIDIAHGIRQQIGESNYSAVVDAIESGKIGKLPADLRGHAVTLRSHLANVRKVQRRAGIKVPERKGYVPRQLTEDAIAADAKKASRPGKASTKPNSSKARTETRPMSEVRVKKPGRYREDLHALVAERLAEGTGSAAKADLNRSLAELGTPVKRGMVPALKDGEAVFHFKAGEPPREVEIKSQELARAVAPLKLNKQGTKVKNATSRGIGAGRYVVLNKDVVKRATEGAAPSLQGPGIIHTLDKATSGFKRLALGTLGFHVRNAVGDTAQAYINQPGHKLAGNLARAKGVTKELNRQEKAARKLERPRGEVLFHGNLRGEKVGQHVGTKQAAEDRLAHRNEGGTGRLKGFRLKPEAKVLDLSKGKQSDIQQGWMEFGRSWAKKTPAQRQAHLDKVFGFADHNAEAKAKAEAIWNEWASSAKRAEGYDAVRYRNDTEDPGSASYMVLNHKALEKVPVLKTTKYGHVSYEDLAHNLVNAGGARSGYTARELKELSTSGGTKGAKILKPFKALGGTKAGAAGKRTLLNREDVPRLATAIHALQNGATWEEAASKVAATHFDYGHLTSFERNIARRLMPFYTWSARNIPFQTKMILQKPGKYAAYQKAREEFAATTQPDKVDEPTKALYKQLEQAGVAIPGGYEKYLSQYEQRNAGLPISVGGKKFTLSAGLPFTDLNEFPGAALKNQLDEYYQKGMSLTGPVPKDLVEYMDNHSFFFRDQLERDNSPLVAAPSWASKLPAPFRKWADVGPIVDKQTGKKVLGWKGKADYVFSAVPGTPQYIKQFTTQGTNQQGKGTVGKVLGYSGLKVTPINPTRNAVNLAYAREAEIQKQQAALKQQGINASNPTPEYTKLSAQLKLVKQIAYQGKAAQGYKVLPTQGGPPKLKPQSGFKFGASGHKFKFNQGSSGFKFR